MATGVDESPDAGKRNLVVDENAFEEQFLRCHICHDKFDQDDKTPKSLPCNHTFCLPCLQQCFDHSQGNARRAFTFADDTYEGVLKCPSCRVEIFLSRGEISSLPNDHRVIQMMDFLSQVTVKSQNVCPKHENQPLNFFCKTCQVPVCRDCTVLDHKEQQGDQGSHVIVDVSQALNDNADEFNNAENRSKQLLQTMKSRSDSLANASKQLDLLERVLRGKIKDTFIEYRLLLERRQEGLIAILHDMIKNQKALINAKFVDVCTKGSKLQKLYDSFTKARPTNDITKIFKVHSEMKDHEKELAEQADATDDNLFVACLFEVDNEPMFLSEMSCLGEVTQQTDLELKKPVPAHKLVVMDMDDRRIQAEAQGPDPADFECDDRRVTQIDQSSRSRDRELAERVDRLARLRARIAHREGRYGETRHRDIDQDEDDTEEMEHDYDSNEITSSYLLRIASRLNESSANLSEAILDLSTDRQREPSPDSIPTSTSSSRGSSSRRQGNGPSPPRSRRSSANVRVVRHPQNARTPPDRSDRYIPTRYERRSTEEQ